MAESLHPVTIKLSESKYNAAKEVAEERGYLSVEEFVSDWLENETGAPIAITADITARLEEGLADSREGRVISLDEHNARHAERRAAWIRSHQA